MPGMPSLCLAGLATVSLALSSCTRDEGFVYRSPDGVVALAVQPKRAGRPTAGEPNQVFLVGERLAEPPGSKADRVLIGTFPGAWNPGAIAWVDETTVNICPLAGRRGVTTAAKVVVKWDGTRRAYSVTTDCLQRRRVPRSP